jgi:hypothetical protein
MAPAPAGRPDETDGSGVGEGCVPAATAGDH